MICGCGTQPGDPLELELLELLELALLEPEPELAEPELEEPELAEPELPPPVPEAALAALLTPPLPQPMVRTSESAQGMAKETWRSSNMARTVREHEFLVTMSTAREASVPTARRHSPSPTWTAPPTSRRSGFRGSPAPQSNRAFIDADGCKSGMYRGAGKPFWSRGPRAGRARPSAVAKATISIQARW